MSHIFTAGSTVALSLALDDGATGFFPRAFIFSNGSLITSVDLGHISLGRYSGTWVPAMPVMYDALFIVYEDAGHTTESTIYTHEMEKWQPDTILDAVLADIPGDTAASVWDEFLSSHTIADSAGEFLNRLTAARADNIDDTNVRVRLLEKIWRNKLELADGDTGNWILYDDDNATPLLTWSVRDKDGDVISQHKYVPSRRTRGV